MKIENFKKAKELDAKIRNLEAVLTCFFWDFSHMQDESIKKDKVSTNPSIIIEFDDGDGRDQHKVPMSLNKNFIELIQLEVSNELDILKKEFEKL